jgi:heat shock protein HtpX
MAMFFGGGRRNDNERGGGLGALLMLILGPIAATLIQLAISRTREYSADATSAQYTGNPNELISGLQKLDTWSKRIPMDASPATAHMFIVKPFTGGGLTNLFSTHPSTADRIARLRAMR